MISLTSIPIIIFNSWKLNLLLYGGIALVFVLWVLWNLFSDKNLSQNNSQQNYNQNYNSKEDKVPKFKCAETLEELKTILVNSYYNLEENLSIRAYFLISADEIIRILSDKKIFIFNNSLKCSTTQSYYTDVNIEITYTQGFKIFCAILDSRLTKNLSEQDKMVHDKIQEIFSQIIKPEMSDFEKELAVHDFLILTSRYDYENYKANTIPSISHTPYGLLFKNKAVCSAYAEVFMIFMTLANIECYYVIGSVKDINGISTDKNKYTGHAWNIVRIQNQYYHIDVTFDNPVPDVIGKVNYNYFNISDSIIDKTHAWNRYNYPCCNSMEYNYHNYLYTSKN